MKELSYLLVTDGRADRALMPILTWLLQQFLHDWAVDPHWIDPYQLPQRPPGLASNRLKWLMEKGLNLYENADLLFVHRDAERQSPTHRKQEIEEALSQIIQTPPPVCVIPVRMLEAWLLFDEPAIRMAAGNPNGRIKLDLPPLSRVEALSDPKQDLYELLKEASGLAGRRLKKFRPHQQVYRVAELIDDFTPLRHLSAFQTLEDDLQNCIDEQGWAN
jgi:hypothetical protein